MKTEREVLFVMGDRTDDHSSGDMARLIKTVDASSPSQDNLGIEVGGQLVPKTGTSRSFEPIFVVGCPRSGTTLLTVMLDRHDQIAMTPETHFVAHAQDARRRGVPNEHEAIVDFFLKSHLHDLHLDRDALFQRFRGDEPTYAQFFQHALELFGERQGKTRVGEKSPEHILSVPQILEWYPESKIIWLLRDGRDCAQALTRGKLFHNNRRRHCHLWRATVQAGLTWEERYPTRILRVHFEDIIRDPRRELSRISEFLGIEFQESQLDSTVNSGVVLEKEREVKGRANQALDFSKIGEYARQTSDREKWLMDSIMAKDLARLGYPTTDIRRPPMWIRIWDAFLNAPLAILYDYRALAAKRKIGFWFQKVVHSLRKRPTQAGRLSSQSQSIPSNGP